MKKNTTLELEAKITFWDTEINATINNCADSFKSVLIELLKELQEQHKINTISVHVNNHEWNDGDATSFSMNFEPSSFFEDKIDKSSPKYIIGEKLETLFDKTNPVILEKLFGDSYETMEISLNKTGTGIVF